PGVVALAMPGNWVLGVLGYNLWSFAGPSDEENVNFFLFQYFFNYNLSNGWYLTTTPIITANWEADSDDRWTIPFGGGAGRLVKFGKQPVDFKAQAFWYADAPENGPEWALQFMVKFLFPK
ncbi:MAG: neuromedin U, partial [Thermodesulfobacteriota bacterium]|nr:neuromedin U [Thermodesulfobacteriota bacterium]